MDIDEIFRIWTQDGIGYTVSCLTTVLRSSKKAQQSVYPSRSACCLHYDLGTWFNWLSVIDNISYSPANMWCPLIRYFGCFRHQNCSIADFHVSSTCVKPPHKHHPSCSGISILQIGSSASYSVPRLGRYDLRHTPLSSTKHLKQM